MHVYFAIFSPEGTKYNVEFPDLDGAFTFGEDLSDALFMAKDLLEGWLILADNEGDEIPTASAANEIKTGTDDLLVPIQVDLELAKKKHSGKLIKKTLTIPEYLNDLGKVADINFSATLTDALKEKLGV